jgi:hypothetical protein
MDVLFAVAGWLLTGLAAVSMAAGNPTAINGVVGAGVLAVIFTGLAIFDRA